MGNKISKTSEQAADLCTECYQSQDPQIPISEEPTEEVLQLHQSCVTLNINAETTTFQKGHRSEQGDVPSDEITLNSQEIDSQLPTSVAAGEGMEDTKDHSSRLPHQDEETAEDVPINTVSLELSVAETRTESGCTKDANTQTEEDFNMVQFSLDNLMEFTQVDNKSPLLQFVSENKQKIQTLVDSLQILLSNTHAVAGSPENETEQEDDHLRPTESTPLEVEQKEPDSTLESPNNPEADTDSPNVEPDSSTPTTASEEFNQTSSQDNASSSSISSETEKQEDVEQETEQSSQTMIRFRALEKAYQEDIKPTTSDWQPSMISVPTSELPSFPRKKSLWRRFKKGISKPFRIFKK